MSTTDVQSQSPSSADHDVISEPTGSSSRGESPHDNHEANGGNQTDLAEEALSPSQEDEPADLSNGTSLSPESNAPLEDTTNAADNTPVPEVPGDAPAAAKAIPANSLVGTSLSTSISPATKAKGSMVVTTGTKTTGTSPVKKPATAVSRTIPGPAASGGTTPTSPLKKPTASTMSKLAASTTRSSAAGATAPVRRTSLATTGTKPASSTTSRTSLTSSMSGKVVAAESGAALTRASVISPSGSVSSLKSSNTSALKPRASILEAAAKKPAPTTRSAAAAKPTISSASATPRAPARALSGSVSKSSVARPGSISSIKEVKEDGNAKALDDLQNQLSTTNDELKSKTEAVAELRGQVENLKVSLDVLQAEMETKNSQATEAVSSKAALEMMLQESKDEFTKLQVECEELESAVSSSRGELEAAKAAANSSNELVTKLNEQISALQSELSNTKDNLVALRVSRDAAVSDAETAATADKEALLKARSDLEAIAVETEQLKQAQASVLDEAQTKIIALEKKAQEAESLQSRLNALNAEKEETAVKVSELEIEILELKEAQEVLEDERDQLKETIKALEGNLTQSRNDISKAVEDLETAEVRHATAIEDLQKKHAEELTEAAERHSQVSQALNATQGILEAANLELEKVKKAAVDAEEAHKLKSLEIEQAYMTVQNELTERLASVSAELESQEAQYNAKVQDVKDEHDKLLQQAFERAKYEAGEEHAKELQALRAQSKAAIEEIQTASSNTLRELKAEHASNLEAEIQGLNKQLSSSKLELKVTQDDLVKAKSTLEVSRSEVESLNKQFKEVAAAAEAMPEVTPEHTAENERLARELSITKDDLAAMTEMLSLTKSSMTEISDHHTRDLEEAAQARAEEVSKLKAVHEEEVLSLAREKGDLAVKLSDMEGELATMKAELSSLKASPKVNGTGMAAGHDVAPPPGGVVTDEMLRQVHEAYNLKRGDLEAEHDKAVKVLQQQLDDAQKTIGDLGAEISRKTMEIQFMESENDEQSEAVTRLKDDIHILKDQLVKAGIEPQVKDCANEE